MEEIGYTSLLLPCVGECSCVVYWIFFSFVGQVLVWSFVVLQFHGNVCIWTPKVILRQMNWFWSFCVEICLVSSSSYLHGLKSLRDANLWLSFDDMKSSIRSLRGIVVCSLIVPVPFSHRIFKYRQMSFINAVQF